MATLFLRNIEQVALFKMEISGQISDGHWENSTPFDHWKDWCRARVAVAPTGMPAGRNFYTKRDRYRLTDKDLLQVVGGRMLGQVRLTRAFGLATAEKLEPFIGCEDDFKVSFSDPTPMAAGDSSGYWKEKAARLKNFGADRIREALADESYGKGDLIKDLKEIAEAMRSSVSYDDPPKEEEETEPVKFYSHQFLSQAVAKLTGLTVRPWSIVTTGELGDMCEYELVTSTGLVVGSFGMAMREDETWVFSGKFSPFFDTAFWEKVQQLGQ